MPSTAHIKLKKLVFSKRTDYTRDSRYRAEYDPDKDISTGYYRNSPVIEIHWKKDLVVLSDCGWRTKTTKELLNTLLPNGLELYRERGEWILYYAKSLFAWAGSQALSLSEHYKIHATPWAVMEFEPGSVRIKPTEPFEVVTVIKTRTGLFVAVKAVTSIIKPRGSYHQEAIKWKMTPVSGLYDRKKDAVNAALTYAAQHKLPYVEKLKQRFISYEFNPYV